MTSTLAYFEGELRRRWLYDIVDGTKRRTRCQTGRSSGIPQAWLAHCGRRSSSYRPSGSLQIIRVCGQLRIPHGWFRIEAAETERARWTAATEVDRVAPARPDRLRLPEVERGAPDVIQVPGGDRVAIDSHDSGRVDAELVREDGVGARALERVEVPVDVLRQHDWRLLCRAGVHGRPERAAVLDAVRHLFPRESGLA